MRTFDNGKLEKFGEDGHLRRISDKNGNFIELTYGKDRHLSKLVDNFNRKMFFSFNNQGLLESIDGENGKKAIYKYNNLMELVSSKDVDGNAYTYGYGDSKKGDGGHRHNMVEISYSDKTTMVMEYYGRDKQESVKSVKDRDGTLTGYGYDTDPADQEPLLGGGQRQGQRQQRDLLEQVRILHQAQSRRRRVDLQACHRARR